MATAQDIIVSSYRKLGAIQRGQLPSTEELDDGLVSLNALLSSLSEQHVTIPYRVQDIITLLPNKNTYTWGIGGEINTVRPNIIHEAWLEDLNGSSYAFEISMMLREYSRIALKGQSQRPYRGWYEPQYPLGLLTLESKPEQQYLLNTWSLKPFTGFLTLSTDSDMPPAYVRLLTYNLAMDLGPELGANIRPDVAKTAADTLRSIKSANLSRRVSKLSTDEGIQINSRRNGYDIRTG